MNGECDLIKYALLPDTVACALYIYEHYVTLDSSNNF